MTSTEVRPPSLRVLTMGSSVTHTISFMGGPRSDLAYPRALENDLRGRGHDAVVRDVSVVSSRVHEGLRSWRSVVPNWSPDVVVLHYGNMDAIHLMLPVWLQRWAQDDGYRPTPAVELARRRAVRPGWKLLARGQQRLDRRAPSSTFAHRARQFERDLGALVDRIRTVGSPLVLVAEPHVPAETYQNWFPGIAARTEMLAAGARRVVASFAHPDVRVFETRRSLEPLVATGSPYATDGLHLTAPAHALVAAGLAQEVDAWVADRTFGDAHGAGS